MSSSYLWEYWAAFIDYDPNHLDTNYLQIVLVGLEDDSEARIYSKLFDSIIWS